MGYTGNVSSTAPESIVATLGLSAAASSVIATFTPSPASPGSFPAILDVTFEGQP